MQAHARTCYGRRMFLTPRFASPLAGQKTPPSQFVVAKWGLNESPNGSFKVGDKTARLLPTLQKMLGWDSVPLDFEHNTFPLSAAFKAEPEPKNIAAHCVLSVVPGVGIVSDNTAWTPHGVKSITEGLHPDLSPVIKTDDDGEVLCIQSVALCRQGAVTDLHAYSAQAVLSPAQLSAFSAALAAPVSTQNTPTPAMDHKALLLSLLGLPKEATDQDILKAAEAFAAKNDAKPAEAFSAQLKPLADTVAALQARLDKMGESQNTSTRQALTDAAMREGKLIPHGAPIDALPLEAYAALLGALPAGQVPLAARTPEGMKAFTAPTAAVNPAEAEVRRQLGISEEEWRK